MHPAVFLDRDNTLIANDGDLGDPELVRLVDGVPAGLKALGEAGYRLIVVTNQGGVARGAYTEDDVDAVHRRIVAEIERQGDGEAYVERFYYCPFHPDGTVEEYRREHPWRKPGAGMLLQAAADLDLDLSRSWMIGDQPRDVVAGQAAGCRTVLLTADGDGGGDVHPTETVPDFATAVQTVLRHTPPPSTRVGGGSADAAAEGGDPQEGGVALATAVAESKQVLRRFPPGRATDEASSDGLQRSIRELTDELRTRRQLENEFTTLRMAAMLCQLLVLLFALLGVLQLGRPDAFLQWMIGAILLQLFTLTLLVADLRG